MNQPDFESLIEKIQPYTYLSKGRLRSLSRICQYLNANQIPGDIVECGTYKGGSAALLSRYMGDRHLWLYDSFEGMPETTERDGLEAKKWVGQGIASPADVRKVMELVSTQPSCYTIKEGWFKDSFQETTPSKVALLHCDADWYESVTEVLEKFYDLVTEGGCIVLDDFGYWEGCREAFYDFCCRRNEKPLIERVETDQAFWIKGRTCNRSPIPIFFEPSSNGLEGSTEVETLKLKISGLAQEIEALKEKNSFKKEKMASLKAKVKAQKTLIDRLQEEISEIKTNKLWKLYGILARVKNVLKINN